MKRSIVFQLVCLVLLSCSNTSTNNDKMSESHFKKGEPKPNRFWWPNRIDLSPLRQHSAQSNPMGESFDYAKEFEKLDLKKVKKDIAKVMRTSQEWWPADFGHYGPFFIRMAWHSAGTYRVLDGRGGAGGGQQRFEPLNSWPDNANLDKARRLLWPVKKKYGRNLSWADLMILAGNVALEDMGFNTFGFAGGRTDDWEPDLVYWGSETEFLAKDRKTKDGKLQRPLGATQMGLIYVNPEGPDGKPDFSLAGKAIREAFGRMAMNDEETVALIAGGHSFGKSHGAAKASKCVGTDPAGSGLEEQGLGWKNKCGTGKGADTITSGLEGVWTPTPTQWSMQYLQLLYDFEWQKIEGPGGAIQWEPKSADAEGLVPDAHDENKRHKPMMFTTDLALRYDPIYGKISKRFLENPKEFEDAFARAWFKLTHRDMGPRARYVGSEVPSEILSWQDPVPKRTYKLINQSELNALKNKIAGSKLTTQELVRTAWASAASYRGTDMRGGASGARVRLEPQRSWEVNKPQELERVLTTLEKIQKEFNQNLSGNKKVSLADVIVIGGAVGVEKAAKSAGFPTTVSVKLGRTDASQKNTDVESFEALEPKADPFRNYYSKEAPFSPIVSMVDRANLLTLSVPEMTVLVGGMRAMGANTDNSHGIFTERVGALTPDFFVNLYDMSTVWEKSEKEGLYIGRDRETGKKKWTATPVDLAFGSSAELRAVGEVYASDDGKRKFVKDFVKTWEKVMRLDRF